MQNKVVVGIDQSYKNTGISICVNNKVVKTLNIDFKKCKCNSEKRKILRSKLNKILYSLVDKKANVVILIERIRTQQDKFLNMNYIKSIGALNSVIVDVAYDYDIEVYSVDTRSWKSNIVGTSKPLNNNYKINPKKYPTILYIKKIGLFKNIIKLLNKNEKKFNFIINDKCYKVDDDIADAICISKYGFLPKSKQKIILEKN